MASLPVAPTHGQPMAQDFRIGRVHVLVCTELMSRGVDFKSISMDFWYYSLFFHGFMCMPPVELAVCPIGPEVRFAIPFGPEVK